MSLGTTKEYSRMTQGTRTLPPGWRRVRLGEICEIIAGQSPPSETYRKIPEGLPFFQGKVDFGLRNPVPRVWCVAPIKIAHPGDILISVRAPVGPTNVANVECCIGRGLAAIRCKEQSQPDFILLALKLYEDELARKGSGSTFSAIGMTDLENLEISIPDLPEQHRIAAILNEQMAALECARAAAQAQFEAVKALPTAYLITLFQSDRAGKWTRKRLGDVSDLLPSKSISTDGDTEVRAVTTACLTETGFSPSGVKAARMWGKDAAQCILSKGEVLVARSNTQELVGRSAMFAGNPEGCVATDLTIRILPKREIISEFLAAYLSFLHVKGYWRDRAGGASGSMKKITREQIQAEQVPVPSIVEQEKMTSLLSQQMMGVVILRSKLEETLRLINYLPAIFLRVIFNGEL